MSSQRTAMLLPGSNLDCGVCWSPFYRWWCVCRVGAHSRSAPPSHQPARPSRGNTWWGRGRQRQAHTLLPASWPAAAPLTACQTLLLGPGLVWQTRQQDSAEVHVFTSSYDQSEYWCVGLFNLESAPVRSSWWWNRWGQGKKRMAWEDLRTLVIAALITVTGMIREARGQSLELGCPLKV